jgi:hypothetical protein
MKLSRVSGVLAAFVALAFAHDARAQSPGQGAGARPENYTYHFTDDDLLGDTLGTPPPILRGSYRPRRILLIRPRVRFVAELVDAVENL